ncbi:MAG: glycoside hydrolase family 38 C-terminal domain-containing protein, partial [Ruthenibacterium sp.]
DEAMQEILDKIDFSACSKDDKIVVVFNPHPWPVNEIVNVCIAVPRANEWSFTAKDCDGNPLHIQEIARDEKAYPVHDQEARPWPYPADRHFLYLETGTVPAFGYQTIVLHTAATWNRTHFYWLPARESIGADICHSDNILENEHLRVQINANGTLCMTDKQSNRVYNNLHYFEDTGDVGNYWAYAAPYHNETYTTLTGNVDCWCENNGPLSATLAVKYTLQLPAESYESRYGIEGKGGRSEKKTALSITSRFTLKKGANRLDVHTEFTNTVKNHRLRLALPTGIEAKTADAAGHFTVDERPAKPVKNSSGTYWPEMQTLPMQNFVDVSDGQNGFALLQNCLTEYELRDDEPHTLYATLLRSMGNMIVTWTEAVGEFDDQIGSQVLRPLAYDYGLYPHKGNWVSGDVYK